jgi:hypothetical protein
MEREHERNGPSMPTAPNRCVVLVALLALLSCCPSLAQSVPSPAGNGDRGAAQLAAYRAELAALRHEFAGKADLPDVPFFLFGMGQRTKLVYKAGALIEVASGQTLRSWPVREATIIPPAYSVFLTTTTGAAVRIVEDQQAVWIEEQGGRQAVAGTRHGVRLPSFRGHRYAGILRVLHQELLFNIIGGKPVPNLFVYPKPWYRDGAMTAMCLKATGNLDTIRDWVLGLREPYDRNNAGQPEADNLGQALYLISLVSDRQHPLVEKILRQLPRFEVAGPAGKYLKGRTDLGFHPAYQTKWAKYGLRALGLPDPYTVPRLHNSYSALFWMDFHDTYVAGPDAGSSLYPYLDWASDHFHGTKRAMLGNRDYPLSWEKNSSEANYAGMDVVAPVYARQRLSVPHTWHAAEMFLYLLARDAAPKR